MRAATNASVRTIWLTALLMLAAGATRASAQEEFDETQTTTLSDTPPGGGAQLSPEQADQQARALFQQGRAAYEDGRYRDAWDYFRRAYLLSKRPELLYNVGQSADRLRMDKQALEAFELYLKRLPDAGNRREVENRVRALKERLGQNGNAAATAGGATQPDQSTLGAGKSETEIFGSAPLPPPPPPPPPANGQPTRTGFYLRLALGPGWLHDGISGGGFSGAITSLTLGAQVGAGYDIDQGIVIGGLFSIDGGLSPSVSVGSAKSDLASTTFSVLAAFVDYYFEPRQDGWHLMGGLGGAAMTFSDRSATVGNKTPSGGLLLVAGGYEWPLDKQWALGVLGRIVLARLSEDPRNHTVFAPSVSCTAAWY